MHISKECYRAIQKVIGNIEAISNNHTHLSIRKEYFDRMAIEFSPCMVEHIQEIEREIKKMAEEAKAKTKEMEKENAQHPTETFLAKAADRAVRQAPQNLGGH